MNYYYLSVSYKEIISNGGHPLFLDTHFLKILYIPGLYIIRSLIHGTEKEFIPQTLNCPQIIVYIYYRGNGRLRLHDSCSVPQITGASAFSFYTTEGEPLFSWIREATASRAILGINENTGEQALSYKRSTIINVQLGHRTLLNLFSCSVPSPTLMKGKNSYPLHQLLGSPLGQGTLVMGKAEEKKEKKSKRLS